MTPARIIKAIETQVKTKLRITSGFKIVFHTKGTQILIYVYDRGKRRINSSPLLFAEVDRNGKLNITDSPELGLFLLEILAESEKSKGPLSVQQRINFLFELITQSYRQHGTYPPNLIGLD